MQKRIAISFLLLASAAHACLGPEMETTTLLSEAPRTKAPYVAKVEILTARSNDSVLDVTARVVDVLKGEAPKKGADLTIHVELTSCSHEPAAKKGETYFVAGSVDAKGAFTGTWTQAELAGEPAK